MKRFISVLEAAKLLSISRVAVVQNIQAGKIPAQKVGKAYVIDRDEISLPSDREISEARKAFIFSSVKEVVQEYGEALRLLKDA